MKKVRKKDWRARGNTYISKVENFTPTSKKVREVDCYYSNIEAYDQKAKGSCHRGAFLLTGGSEPNRSPYPHPNAAVTFLATFLGCSGLSCSPPTLRPDLCDRARFPWSFLTKRQALLHFYCLITKSSSWLLANNRIQSFFKMNRSRLFDGQECKAWIFHLNYCLSLYIHICRLMKKCFYVSIRSNAIFCNSKMIVFSICSFFK